MDSLKVEDVLKNINATQLKSLLKLVNCPFSSKLKSPELLEISLTRKDITVPIIINFLKLDIDALVKKINRVPPKPKLKKSENIFDLSKITREPMDEVSILE